MEGSLTQRYFFHRIFHIIVAIMIVASIMIGEDRTTPGRAALDAASIRVANNGVDAPACGSQEQPCRTIQYAIDKAYSGDTILLAGGTYDTEANCSTGPAVACIYHKSLTIKGGYSADNWSYYPADNLSIIDGRGVRRGVEVRGSEDIWVGFQDITIQNGFVNYPLPNLSEFIGGGLLCWAETAWHRTRLSFTRVTFRGNVVQGYGNKSAAGGGAGLYYNCPAQFSEVLFENNHVTGGNAPDSRRGAYALGGGLLATMGSDVFASNITFRNNSATAGSGGSGVGADGARADGLGGGAALQHNAVFIDGATLIGNQATGGNADYHAGTGAGGGMLFELNTGTIVIKNLWLEDNHASGGHSPQNGGIACGGGIMVTDAVMDVSNSSFIENYSLGGNGAQSSEYGGGDAGGGGLYLTRISTGYPATVRGENLVFAANVSRAGEGSKRWGGGGAIYNQNGDSTFSHITLSGNSVLDTMQGPAIASLNYLGSSVLRLQYSIVANHPFYDSYGIPRAAIVAQTTGDYAYLNGNLFHNNTSNYSHQPGLAPSVIEAYNDMEGDPRFFHPDPPYWNYHIAIDSAARDQAAGSSTPYDIDEDQRPFGSAPDAGADEYHKFSLVVLPGDSKVRLDWSQGDSLVKGGVSFYEVLVQCERGANPPNQAQCGVPFRVGMQTTYELDGLSNFKQYTFTVSAFNQAGGKVAASQDISTIITNIFAYLPMAKK